VCSLGCDACTKVVASSGPLLWLGATLSTRSLSTGVRILETATRRAPVRPLRLR
jgi:hypothetical protein